MEMEVKESLLAFAALERMLCAEAGEKLLKSGACPGFVAQGIF